MHEYLQSGYPFDPPHVRFVSKVYHPNISSQTVTRSLYVTIPFFTWLMKKLQGAICVDILKKAWSPMMTLKLVLQSIQIVLSSPVPDNPQVMYSCVNTFKTMYWHPFRMRKLHLTIWRTGKISKGRRDTGLKCMRMETRNLLSYPT